MVIDYWTGDKDINGAVIEINGRYPNKGRTVNLECKEMAYIIKGSGKVAGLGKLTLRAKTAAIATSWFVAQCK